jgi:hypothetical protein
MQVKALKHPSSTLEAKEVHMFGMFSTLFAIAQFFAGIFMLVVAIGLAIMHPVPGVIGFAIFYFLIVRPIWRWIKRMYQAEVRRQRA